MNRAVFTRVLNRKPKIVKAFPIRTFSVNQFFHATPMIIPFQVIIYLLHSFLKLNIFFSYFIDHIRPNTQYKTPWFAKNISFNKFTLPGVFPVFIEKLPFNLGKPHSLKLIRIWP